MKKIIVLVTLVFSLVFIWATTMVVHTTNGEEAFELDEITSITFEDYSLVAYYPFNGNANDASGNGNDGTVFDALLTTDRFGNSDSAYEFDGTDDHLSVPQSSELAILEDLTVSFWFYKQGNQNGSVITYSCNGETESCNHLYEFLINSDGEAHYGHEYDNGSDQWRDIDLNLQNDTWSFVTLTKDYTNMRYLVHIDGIQQDEYYYTMQATGGDSSNLKIGIGEDDISYPFNGKIDDVRIYNRVLSNSEINSLYHEGGWGE